MTLRQTLGDDLYEGLAACVPDMVSELDRLEDEDAPGLLRGDRGRELLDRKRSLLNLLLTRQAELATDKATKALRRMNPRVSLEGDRISAICELDPRLQFLIRQAGLNKFFWAVAVGASGREDTDALIREYLVNAARWYSLKFLAGLTEETDRDLPYGVSKNSGTEELRRHSPMEIRFTWITELIVAEAAKIVSDDLTRFGPLRLLTTEAAEGLFEYIRAGVWNPSFSDWLSQSKSLPDETVSLLRALSIEAGSLSELSFEDLVASALHEVYPIVGFDDLCAPIALRDAAVNLEQAIFEFARRELPDGKARGDLFEGVIAACLGKVLSDDCVILQPPLAVSIPGTRNPGEVDFAATLGDGGLLVGEAKAYFVAKRQATVINSFEDQVAGAVKQLRLRLDALNSASPLTQGGAPVPLTPGVECVGVAVPLHSYATAVWDGEALSVVEAMYDDISVIPLHQLILVAQTTQDASDMRQYLQLRTLLLKKRWRVQDEADLLVAYVGAGPELLRREIERSSVTHARTVLRPFFLDLQPSLSMHRPSNRSLWIATFLSVCH